MSGCRHIYPRREKLIILVGFALEKEYVSAKDISQYLECTYRTGCRLLNQLYDMRYELKYLKITKKGDGVENDPVKIKIRLNENWK